MKNKFSTLLLILIAFQGFSHNESFSIYSFSDIVTEDSNKDGFEISKSNPLSLLLGKDVFGKEAFEFTSTLGIYETESFRDIRHLQYFNSGVEIVYEEKDKKIASIFLFGPDPNSWYEPYTEKLPYDLNWNMTKQSVENLIGKGEEHQLMSDVFYQYKSLKIQINYFKGSDNPKMQSILIGNFED